MHFNRVALLLLSKDTNLHQFYSKFVINEHKLLILITNILGNFQVRDKSTNPGIHRLFF